MPIKEKDNVSDADKRLMQVWGRYFARDNDRAALDSAAEYYGLSANNEEAASLFFWWEEGVRNNTASQYDTELCHITLHTRALEMFEGHVSEHLGARTDYMLAVFSRGA